MATLNTGSSPLSLSASTSTAVALASVANRTMSTTPQLSQTTKATKTTTRAGAPNYSAEDIAALLDIVEVEEPLGVNHWAVVTNSFSSWAKQNLRPMRDQDSLKNKFDKMANTKKKTGDPPCPDHVRRAKLIARAIHNKCAAMTLGDSSEGEEDIVTQTRAGSDGSSEDRAVVVGERNKKRKTGATGIQKKRRQNSCF